MHRIFHLLLAASAGVITVLATDGCAGNSAVSVESVSVQPAEGYYVSPRAYADVLRKTMTERNDPSYCFPAEIVVTIK